MSRMTTLISLQITTAYIRPQVKWAVNSVIADGHFYLSQGLSGYVCAIILGLSPRGF